MPKGGKREGAGRPRLVPGEILKPKAIKMTDEEHKKVREVLKRMRNGYVAETYAEREMRRLKVESENVPDYSNRGQYGGDDTPAFEELQMTEGEELGLGKERREDFQGENGMRADDCPETFTYQAELSDVVITKWEGTGFERAAKELLEMHGMDTLVNYMDNDLREEAHTEMAPCEEWEFVAEYLFRHHEKYGEEFSIN